MISFLDFISEFSFRRIIIGTALIGISAGVVGVFLYLRRQALLSEVIGNSATPGVMGIFLAVAASPLLIDARSMPVLTIGALVTGLLAAVLANYIADTTRIGIDSTMAVMSSLFLGGGLVLLQVIQRSRIKGKGGMEELMFGNAATLTNGDVRTIAAVSVLVLVVLAVLWRPFSMMTFDPVLSRVSGMPLRWLTPLLLSLIVLAVVIGVKAVGLILMISFAVFPPAAARQWTRTVASMAALSGTMGGFAAVVGTYLSVAVGKVPTGPMIVLVLGGIALVSLVFAPRRGQVVRS